jgi:heme-degrading monooxygenase HmoA
MHTLRIDATLKPGKKDEFIQAWHSQVLPVLKKQTGFVDEIILYDEATHSGTGISLWKSRKDAEHYQNNVFNQAKSPVEHLLVGPPTVRSYEVLASETFHVSSAKAA